MTSRQPSGTTITESSHRCPASAKNRLGAWRWSSRTRSRSWRDPWITGQPRPPSPLAGSWTTLAHSICREMGVAIRSTSGTVLSHAGDFAAILTTLQEGDILFIDEVHRLPAPVEEALYPAMEDFQLDLIIGQGPSTRTIKLDLPRFTLIGATTRVGSLTSPLRQRFGLVQRLH